jgi:hypothetical protein
MQNTSTARAGADQASFLDAARVGRYLLHVRGKWSYQVWEARHKALSFTEFLAGYVGNRLGIGCWLSDGPAAQLLRLATGQPRFLPTKTSKRK